MKSIFVKTNPAQEMSQKGGCLHVRNCGITGKDQTPGI